MIIGIDASLACRKQRTGVELYSYHIIIALGKVIPRDVKVRLYSDRPFPSDIAECVPTHWELCVLYSPIRIMLTQVRLSIEMLFRPPDVLFVPRHILPIIHPRATVVMIHDVAPWRFPNAFSRFMRWYDLYTMARAVKKCPVILVPSNFTREEVQSFMTNKKFSTHAHITTVHHGYEGGNLSFEKISFPDVQGMYKDDRYFLCVGRIEYKKNIDTIVRAFASFKSKNPVYSSHKLVLVGGKGYGYDEIRAIIKENEYGGDIIETGWVDDAMRAQLIRYTDALVYVSRYEGFGIPVFEALSLGTAVIASSGLSIEEIGGEYVTYVPSEDIDLIAHAFAHHARIAPLDTDDIRLSRIDHVKQFTWHSTAVETYRAIEQAWSLHRSKTI